MYGNDILKKIVYYSQIGALKQTILEGKLRNIDELLVIAIRRDNTEIVKLLIENGANVKNSNSYPLHAAVGKRNAEIVKILLEHGANPADCHKSRNYPLYTASDNGDTDIVRMLLDAGADVYECNSNSLVRATRKGHAEITKLLIAAGAPIISRDHLAIRWAIEKMGVARNSVNVLIDAMQFNPDYRYAYHKNILYIFSRVDEGKSNLHNSMEKYGCSIRCENSNGNIVNPSEIDHDFIEKFVSNMNKKSARKIIHTSAS